MEEQTKYKIAHQVKHEKLLTTFPALPNYVNNEKNDDENENANYSSQNGVITGAFALCEEKEERGNVIKTPYKSKPKTSHIHCRL